MRVDDPFDYDPVPLRPTYVVRCTYRFIGRGKPMPFQLEDDPPMIRLLAYLLALRNHAGRCVDWLANTPTGQVVAWPLIVLAAVAGIMCLRVFAP